MKLLSRKPKENSLGILDEKQIQERLYGKYHKGNHPSPVSPVRPEQTSLSPKSLTPPPKKIEIYREWKALSHAWAQAFRHFAKGFPWKVVGSVGIALIAAVLIAENASDWLRTWSPPLSAKSFRQTAQGSETSRRAAHTASATVQGAVPSAGLSQPKGFVPAAPPAVKQKYYAVQVCTYQRAKDAEELVQQLQGLHFSAFYKRTFSQQEQIPLYVVFLERAETYAQAKTQLSEFKKTGLFQKFSDSFILSL